MWWWIALIVAMIVVVALLVARRIGGDLTDSDTETRPRTFGQELERDLDVVETAARPLIPLVLTLVVTLLAIAVLIAILPDASTEPGHGAEGSTTPSSTPNRVGPTSTPAPSSSESAPGPAPTAGLFQTAVRSTDLRADATTESPLIALISPFGSWVTLSCYLSGQSVHGDTDWYQADYQGRRGYVSGLWVNAGDGPGSGLPHCL